MDCNTRIPQFSQAPDASDHIMSIMSMLESSGQQGQGHGSLGSLGGGRGGGAKLLGSGLGPAGMLPSPGSSLMPAPASGLGSLGSGMSPQMPSVSTQPDANGGAFSGLSGFNIWSNGSSVAAAGGSAMHHAGPVTAAAAAWGSGGGGGDPWHLLGGRPHDTASHLPTTSLLPVHLELDVPPAPRQQQQKSQKLAASGLGGEPSSTLRAAAPAYYASGTTSGFESYGQVSTAAAAWGGDPRTGSYQSGISGGSGGLQLEVPGGDVNAGIKFSGLFSGDSGSTWGMMPSAAAAHADGNPGPGVAWAQFGIGQPQPHYHRPGAGWQQRHGSSGG